ncbi:MAG: omptin family outer membrane protease [Nitrospiraceae bacterium]
MTRASRSLIAVIGLWFAVIAPVAAQEEAVITPDARPYSLTVGVREWISQGRSAHNIGGTTNVASELSWRGLNIPITQVHADLVVLNRLVGNVEIGYGSRSHGTLLDQDWSGNNRTDKFSETLSDVSGGSVLTISLTTGLRLLAWNVQDNPVLGGVDALVGYQYWRERYEASGVQNLLTGASSFNGVTALTQTNTWNSIRIGTRATVPILSRVALTGSVFYIPYTAYRNEDIHHLRSDLRKDPSFLSEANGGSGIQLEASVAVRVWQRLTAEVGYAYWDIRSGQGTIQAFNANGSVAFGTHNEDNTRRQGIFFGVNWIF